MKAGTLLFPTALVVVTLLPPSTPEAVAAQEEDPNYLAN